MRTIKFRAWDNVKFKMYYVGESEEVAFAFDSNGITATDLTEHDWEFKKLEHLQYMQFTGLHDKNGTPLYEGDIVVNHRNIHSKEILQVKWQEAESKQADDGILWTHKKPGFVFERINPGMHTVFVAENDFEVIGNIFENEDLLS